MSATDAVPPERRPVTGVVVNRGQFQPGQSGCPGGRPKASYDFAREARAHVPLVLEVLLKSLSAKDWRERHSAASLLLDRALGKPLQKVEGDAPLTLNLMHLVAATAVGEQLQAELAAGRRPAPPDERGPIVDVADPRALRELGPALE